MNNKTLNKSKLDMVDFIDDHNSLLLRNKDGRILFFDTPSDMYYMLLVRLTTEYANGYFEPAHYVMAHYEFSAGEATAWLRSSERHFKLPKVIMVDWRHLSEVDKEHLVKFCQSIHNLLGTPFRLDELIKAFNLYVEKRTVCKADKSNEPS